MTPFRISILAILTSLVMMSCSDGAGTPTENATEVEIDASTPEAAEDQTEATADLADAEFSDPLIDKVFQNYLELQSALVNADAGQAATTAGRMAETLTEERAGLRDLARQIADTDDLETQRAHFAELTTEIESLFADAITAGTVYKIHCPMAFDNEGADWFSEVSEVRNPYFGDKMLTCGRVTAEIIN